VFESVAVIAGLDCVAYVGNCMLTFKMHSLEGELKGHWSIWVNGNWRVTFRFVGADVELVNYVDYH